MAEAEVIHWDESEECDDVMSELNFKCKYLDTTVFWDVIEASETREEFRKNALKWIEDIELEIAELRRLVELIPK